MSSSHTRGIVTNEFIEVWLEDLLYDENYAITWGPHSFSGSDLQFDHGRRLIHLEADMGRFRMNLGQGGTRYNPSEVYEDWDEVCSIAMRWLVQGLR